LEQNGNRAVIKVITPIRISEIKTNLTKT
jgi:hypothetical protein